MPNFPQLVPWTPNKLFVEEFENDQMAHFVSFILKQKEI